MFLTNVLSRLMHRSTSPRRRHLYGKPARQGRAKQARLELESLEYRLVPAGQVLFYNAPDGVAVTGSVDAAGTFTQQQTYGFSAWTHIVGVGSGEVLFYNQANGVAVTGNVDAAGTFTQQQTYGFPAWTHIAGVGGGEVLFYNAPDDVAVTGSVDAAGTFTQQQAYGFSDWTHIVGVGGGEVLFYNSPDSVAVTGNVDAAGTFTQQQAYGFSAWTHIVGVDPFGGVGGGGGAGQPSGPGHLPAILDPWSGPSVLSDEGVLSYQDARHTPAPEVASSGGAEALFGGPQFQKAWGEEFQLRIQHSHASTPQQGFLDESALAVWFSLADDHTQR